MLIRNYARGVLFISLILVSRFTAGQQTVDLEKAARDNPSLFSGNFSRVAIGLSRSTFHYGPLFDGFILSPLHLNLDLGKRMNRKFGAYFSLTGDFLLNAPSLGIHRINRWTRGQLQLGGLYYFTGGNSFFAAEAGAGLLSFEYAESRIVNPDKPLCAGPVVCLRYGYERHMTGRFFLGGQIFTSYYYGRETGVPEGSEPKTASSFTYGAALSLKLGK